MADTNQKEILHAQISAYVGSWLEGLLRNSWNHRGVLKFTLTKSESGNWVIYAAEKYEQNLSEIPKSETEILPPNPIENK